MEDAIRSAQLAIYDMATRIVAARIQAGGLKSCTTAKEFAAEVRDQALWLAESGQLSSMGHLVDPG